MFYHPSDILPSELWDHIFLFVLQVSPKTLRSVMTTCKFFHGAIENNHFWKQAYLSTLPEKIDDSKLNWKQKFILEFGGLSVRFGGVIENGAGANLYLACSALRNQVIQVPFDLVAQHKIVKRGNPFCVPQIKNIPLLQLSFYLGQNSCPLDRLEDKESRATPLYRCCDTCHDNMVSYRTYGFQFDSKGKAQVPLMIHCAPTHDRRRNCRILMQAKIGKRVSSVMTLQFKTGKRSRSESTDTPGTSKIQAILQQI